MRPTYLIDTCASLWIMENLPMRAGAIDALDDAVDRGEKIFVSPITGWEIGNLARKRRFTSQYAPRHWLSLLLARPEIALASLPPHVLLESSLLPGNLVKDPADRIIVATAREYGYVLVTRDRALLDYGRGGYLSVLEC